MSVTSTVSSTQTVSVEPTATPTATPTESVGVTPYTWEEREVILGYAELRPETKGFDNDIWMSFSEMFLHYRPAEEYQTWYRRNAPPPEARTLEDVVIPRYSLKKARKLIDHIKAEYDKNPDMLGNRILQQRKGDSWIESRNYREMGVIKRHKSEEDEVLTTEL